MADYTLDQTLAEREKDFDEKQKLHSSLSPYDLGNGIEEYKYRDLGVPSSQDDPDYLDKKRFRLLNLMSGLMDSPTVYCEIFEVEINIVTDHVFRVQNPVLATSELRNQYAKNSISYEAMSWRWGDESHGEHAVMIKSDDGERKKRVSYTLGLALKNLRHQTRSRIIWIDALCIDQSNFEERNSQVAMMDRLYTGASQICIWLGQDDQNSRKAIKFIKEEINRLKDFDKLCKDSKHAEKWRALLGLMQRDYFSRRWVVQELALARKATVYCGPDEIDWRELAIAIELFVEVESATHRLSELMKKDDRFNVIPNWFEHISELGASLLVTESSKIFRDYKREVNQRPLGLGHLSLRGPGRRSLLSLEYLVTSLSIFDCGRPHDFVYALIAISRDAFPSPPTSITQRSKEALVTEVMKGFVERKPFPLDYDAPYPDVARDFIEFTIQRHVDTGKDEEKALDILCRPWSKDWRPEDEQFLKQSPEVHEKKRMFDRREDGLKWSILPEKVREKYRFKHAPLSVRTEEDGNQQWTSWKEYIEEKGHSIISKKNYEKKWDPWFPKKTTKPQQNATNTGLLDKATSPGTAATPQTTSLGAGLPSWVANVTRAPFDIFPHPGVEMTKMGRKNADPLVGSLDNRTGTYSAAQSKKQKSEEIKFRKRARLGHYSLYVKGFRFDKVEIVEQVSQQGAIPASWLGLGGWDEALRPKIHGADPGVPPDALWRTLVADRGMYNQNPPYYYSRACRETIMKGALRSNAVDTTALIYNERNSIIAEFCRRTQCVIWNRALIKTQNGNLGLVSPSVKKGDLVCIICGCTVPVILRKAEKLKTGRDLRNEMKDDCLETFKRCFKKCLQRRARKMEYIKRVADPQKGGLQHKQEVKEHLSLWKATSMAQDLKSLEIEENEMGMWQELVVQNGETTPETTETNRTDEIHVTRSENIQADLKIWLEGDPEEQHMDSLADKLDSLKPRAKADLKEWLRKLVVEEVAGRVKNEEEWLEERPSLVNQSTIEPWLTRRPPTLSESDPVQTWLWLKNHSSILKREPADRPTPPALVEEMLEFTIWQWLQKLPENFETNEGGVKEWLAKKPEGVSELKAKELVKNIKKRLRIRKFLDEIVSLREEKRASEQEMKIKNELHEWKKRQPGSRTESMSESLLQQDQNQPEFAPQSEGQNESEASMPSESQEYSQPSEESVIQVSKRWSQLTSSKDLNFKASKRERDGADRPEPRAEHLSSDEESDKYSDDDEEDWMFTFTEMKQQEVDSDSDDGEDQDAGGSNKKEADASKDGKKERQKMASENDPFRHYKFLGEAYIHGMMEGEAVSQSFYRKKPEHLFELR